EALIWQAASLKRSDFFEMYHAEELHRKKLIFTKMRSSQIWGNERASQEDVESVKKELKRFNKVELQQLAKDLELHSEYFYLHNCFSSEVHHLPHTMGEYLVLNDQGFPSSFVAKPSTNDSSVVIIAAFECVLSMVSRL